MPKYFLYDPQDEYLNPCLQGYRLAGEGTYVRIDSNVDGRLECQQLGLNARNCRGVGESHRTMDILVRRGLPSSFVAS